MKLGDHERNIAQSFRNDNDLAGEDIFRIIVPVQRDPFV